jgi:regulator of sirC expression with transglutaminase-like and TPR domain
MDTDAALRTLADDPSALLDVGEVALRLARDEYPDLDVEAYLSELDGMAREARNYVRGDLDGKVTGLCRYLFHEMGFHGNTQNYYDPQNSYLNQVLDRRTGLPITLSILAMSIGARTGLRVEGIGLPGHFVAKAVANGETILFDPFHGGRRLSPDHCEHLVQQVTGVPFQATPMNLEATPLGLIVQRLLTNLKGVYLRQQDFVRAIRVIERLRQLNSEDPLQRRDLGICLIRSGQPGAAINHLDAYLEAHPQNADAELLRKMIQEARSEIAKWN